jgi:hypothetical protein
MERRREHRGILDQSVKVTLLKAAKSGSGDSPHQPIPQSFIAQTIDQSGRGMRLLVPYELVPGTTIKIETDDTLFLGEICYCNRVNEERFAAGIEVSQSLQMTTELRKLADAVGVGSSSRRPVARDLQGKRTLTH